MKIELLTLCDKATVREGLLHMLGGGIGTLWRPAFPAPMAVDLVILLSSSAGDLDRQHTIQMQIASDDGEQTVIRGDVSWEPVPTDTLAQLDDQIEPTLPLVLPLQAVALPRAGYYKVNVRLDGRAARRLRFRVIEGVPEGAATPMGATVALPDSE